MPENIPNSIPYEEAVQLRLTLTTVINYALQQNRIPLIQSFEIHNPLAADLENVVVKLRCEPELICADELHLARIPAGTDFSVSEFRPRINAALLAELTERMVGQLSVLLENAQGELLAQFVTEITALAFDEWHGTAFYPELLCAFVTPNHPDVTKIAARAARLLGEWSGDPSLNAYQTQNPNRVLLQAAAIYGALQEQNLVYCVAPASFEPVGQRVRLCDAVMRQKLGTCLDLTLFYAGCLEAIGLHPILLLQTGHIFAGVWLEDLSFSESVENDPALITKRIAEGVNEIAVVECTAFTAGQNMSFDEAKNAAVRKLYEPEPPEYIIDVFRARLSGIKPLPQRIAGEAGWKIESSELSAGGLTAIPEALSETIQVDEIQPAERKSTGKLAQWERKLLDLSLRNTLINLRWTQNVIPILTQNLSDLEDALSSGAEYGILPRPSEWAVPETERRNLESFSDLGIYANLIQTEFQNKRLRSFFSEGELAGAIVNIYRSSRTSLEENGANTLYLAVGFLRWYETTASEKPRYAPLVLLPVEIIRKSALKGYVIRLRDEDPQMNITLLQMLFQDFGIQIQGIDPLPQDAQGVDLRTLFTVMRKAIMDQPRWDVIPAAFLGIFSFSQFVMWNDLRNRADTLQKNKIVRSLISGHLAWDAQEMSPGKKVSEDDTLIPVPTDASQLYAIQMAAQGESFVLHGPPGTGKSQTITGMIANALAKGKTVLFVAEKMAALSVVQQRLNRIGIGPFCLELHSNKSNKRDVLNQLQAAAEITRQNSSGEWAKKAEQTAAVRKELDLYARALHEKQPSGLSLYEMIAAYIPYADCPKNVSFSPEFAESCNPDTLHEQQLALHSLMAAARVVNHPYQHPLAAVGKSDYTQQLKQELPLGLSDYTNALRELNDTGVTLSQKIEQAPPQQYSEWLNLHQLADELAVWFPLPRTWCKDPDWMQTAGAIQTMCGHFQAVQNLSAALSPLWDEGFFQLDATQLQKEWTASLTKWALPKLLVQNRLLKAVRSFQKPNAPKITKEALPETFRSLADYQANHAEGQRLFAQYGTKLGKFDQGNQTDWTRISQAAETAKQSAAALLQQTGSECFRTTFAGEPALDSPVIQFLAAFTHTAAAKEKLYRLLEIGPQENEPDWISAQLVLCEKIRSHTEELKDWMVWATAAKDAARLGLSPVVQAYCKGLPHQTAESAYFKGLYTALIVSTLEKNPVLNRFSGAVFEEKIRQFRQLDEELIALAKQEIFFRLAAQVPNFTQEASQKSEVGVLQRAIRSGGRGLSIRRLFEQISNLLPRLCPCMLMSPLSAAQYLEPGREPFDLVIFDEASQMPTARAVGALARGTDAVIVGDPKQMPPTSFFAGSSLDEENLSTEDLESILDDALALNMPQTHLLWHYRSRHESLIAFSNTRFYENKLYTFPSVNDLESKVTLVSVTGFFDRGKSRQNRAEAQAVVQEIIRRSKNETCKNQSVGVVCFNIQQQNLIDDLFSEACRTDPELEHWAYEAEEPLLIKNLESVQGDERDVILFSIGYGPDATGKTYMNFGPLNREGGWRRLNVAVSRARQEMKVFSCLRADQIDLSRSAAEGVAALKAFLSYAAGESLCIAAQNLPAAENSRYGIAAALQKRLEQAGYASRLQVGHSKYRMDIGVVDPKKPNQYLLGILLDGASYQSAKTTRDREIAQVQVLCGLGWRIHRLWSVDWWDNAEKEFEKILALLKIAASSPAESLQENTQPKKIPIVAAASQKLESCAPNSSAKTVSAPETSPVQKAIPYQPAVISAQPLTPEEYLLPQNSQAIQNALQCVLEQEAPISEPLLLRRAVQSFGISRAGARIQQRTMLLLGELSCTCTESGGKRFYWRKEQDPETYAQFRTSISGVRDADDIPVQETVNAVVSTLRQQIAMPKEELLRETANLLGYSRLGNVVVAAVSAGIAHACQQKKITEQKNDYYAIVV